MGRHRRISQLPRTTLASRAALAAGALVPTVVSVGSAHAATPQAAICASDKPELAEKLSEDINSALDGASATTAISLHDRTTNTTCALDADRKFDSASTVKVTVLATLLWDAQKDDRALTQEEKDRATAMITKSDNDATTALWNQLGAAKVNAFLLAAGMTNTVLDSEGHWGLTQITANDEEKLLQLVTHANPVLGEDSRAYILKLTGEVIPSQRWGTPAGAPGDAQVHVKNGWLERATNGWRVHSLGAFTGGDHDYTITVLTQDNATMDDGIANIEGIARAVHENLNAPASSARP
ncbi:class A beta-lactamase-related serine hydrolase [Streptomyces malaysiensis]|uniref:Class A beta-lactamase-related serine hydrolase n=1 Tax=Streptomyces malaysiensis subsp. samsunensis TaxID=459658 RepID=A0A9X2M798_STRMQ|nr:class A beta-lactamase-related serine hydrolase [Streptomyces samsunensis]MCQ8836391.1 class A beta-lactamase-related serine hydrolase [Streptomyces samsunensis]